MRIEKKQQLQTMACLKNDFVSYTNLFLLSCFSSNFNFRIKKKKFSKNTLFRFPPIPEQTKLRLMNFETLNFISHIYTTPTNTRPYFYTRINEKLMSLLEVFNRAHCCLRKRTARLLFSFLFNCN